MNYFTTAPTVEWTKPSGTWMDGTFTGGTTSIVAGSSNNATTSGTTNRSDSVGSTHTESRITTGVSIYVDDGQTSNTSFGATTNNTATTQTALTTNRYEQSVNIISIDADTSRQTVDNRTTFQTNGTATSSTAVLTTTNATRTYLASATGIGSSSGTVGNSTVTTTATQVDGWSLTGVSTSSYTITAQSTTSWTTTQSVSTFASSQTTAENTASTITYSEDTRTTGTTATVTATSHVRSPLQDTVVMMNASRDADDYNLGNELWKFSHGSLPATASTAGVFTELFSSVSAATETIPEYSRFISESAVATAITVSYNTTATTTVSQTGASTSDTVTSAITMLTTWKNGVTWNSSDTSNTVTVTHTFDLGAVSTSNSTYTDGSPVSTLTATDFFGTYQETGYTDSGWTTTTATSTFGASSHTATRLALNSHVTTTAIISSRVSTTEEMLVSKFSSVGTSWRFVGLEKTTSTRVFEASATTTSSAWVDLFNQSVENYTTSSTAASVSTNYSQSEIKAFTYRTESRVTPEIWSIPYNAGESPFLSHNNAWHNGPPHGYGGAGGNFTASSLPVFLSATVGLAAGGTFATSQSFGIGNLPTALAYSGVTFFPDRTDYPITVPAGAVAASYISRIDSLGQAASIAVTWTASTSSGTTTTTTSTAATYTVGGLSSISGSFYRQREITFNTSDVRGSAGIVGGYALGDNAIGSNYTVRVASGRADWTAYSSDSSVSTGSASSTAGSVSFTVPASLAIVLSAQPVLSMSWGAAADEHFSSSVPHFPTT